MSKREKKSKNKPTFTLTGEQKQRVFKKWMSWPWRFLFGKKKEA
ncbi:MAG: hypothetical protein ABIH48_00290 [Candidatus Falkowbacteria bacterium]